MIRYRNVRTRRVVERPTADEWLEASSGWERIDEPAPAPAGEDWLDVEPASADNEEEDD